MMLTIAAISVTAIGLVLGYALHWALNETILVPVCERLACGCKVEARERRVTPTRVGAIATATCSRHGRQRALSVVSKRVERRRTIDEAIEFVRVEVRGARRRARALGS